MYGFLGVGIKIHSDTYRDTDWLTGNSLSRILDATVGYREHFSSVSDVDGSRLTVPSSPISQDFHCSPTLNGATGCADESLDPDR
jgi:hypothetical protein